MTDYTELKRLADRALNDRRFCGDENHKALADGVATLISEIEHLTDSRNDAREERNRLGDRYDSIVVKRNQLQAFAVEMVNASFEGGSFDGGDIQDIAVKHDLLCIEQREDECGEGCSCREYGFPAQCFRKTPILKDSAENSAPQNASDENVAQDREEKNV